MGQLTQPKTYLVGFSELDKIGFDAYLKDSGNTDFDKSITAAQISGVSNAEILCSAFAKLCYSALTLGKNSNITRVRDIPDNIRGCFDHGHGSVFEHVWLNFITRDCSRIFTHELVRHRVGTAFSQTSGRYVRLDAINLVWDPILDPVKDLFKDHITRIEATIYLAECRLGLRQPPVNFPDAPAAACLSGDGFCEVPELQWVVNNSLDFATRKKLTSAIRRIAPNGQSNEIAWSANLRSLRHLVMVRTAPGAEWEIRLVFNQVYNLAKEKWPLMFYGARETTVDGLIAIDGMKLQPYEMGANEPK